MLVVGDRDCGKITGHLGGDRELTRGDEGVVRRFEMRGVVPIDTARRQSHKEEDQAAEECKRATPQYAPARLVAARLIIALAMLIFALRRQRLNVGSTRRTILRGRCSHLDPIATGVLQWPAIADQIPGRASD